LPYLPSIDPPLHVILKSIIVLQHFINSHPAFKMRRFHACDIKKEKPIDATINLFLKKKQ
jgi:hypothetical protein